jgi:hypothetical protein
MPSLGDAIYCRPFIKPLSGFVNIETNWPDLYSDVEVIDYQGDIISPRYDTKNLAINSIVGSIEQYFPPVGRFEFDLPIFDRPDIGSYIVVRPPTLRKRLYGPARNPSPEYIVRVTNMARDVGYSIVSIGNVDGEEEYFDGVPPLADYDFTGGELGITELFGIISGADMIIGGPGYTVPAAMAYDVPHLLIYGGTAKWNSLDKLTDPRIGSDMLIPVYPDNFCRECRNIRHDCDKTISDFERKAADAINKAMHLRQTRI